MRYALRGMAVPMPLQLTIICTSLTCNSLYELRITNYELFYRPARICAAVKSKFEKLGEMRRSWLGNAIALLISFLCAFGRAKITTKDTEIKINLNPIPVLIN